MSDFSCVITGGGDHDGPGGADALRASVESVLGQSLHLGQADVDDRVDLGREASDVDAEQAVVGVALGVRVDGVGQGALLAHLLEQSAAHAAAERGGQHREGVATIVAARDSWDAEDEVGLLGRALGDLHAGRVRARTSNGSGRANRSSSTSRCRMREIR